MSNKIHITGRLGRDSELRYAKSGDTVLGFSVADDIGYGEKKKTQWFECSIWGKRAETLAQYLAKGQQVVVHGQFELSHYTEDGIEKSKLVCSVSDIDLVGGRQESLTSQSSKPQRQSDPQAPQAPQNNDFDSDDIPF
jgi:single-strand DNA-binding protein